MNNHDIPVYWHTLQHGAWHLHVAATDAGLCYVALPHQTLETLTGWVKKHVPGSRLIQDEKKLHVYTTQIVEYLDGSRLSFSFPLDLRGTPFQVQVWQALLSIPFGATQSYSEIAATIGNPTALRAVGAANGANPIPIVVPCHRVIGKNGTLTGYSGGLAVKEQLLNLEQRGSAIRVRD